MYLILFDFDGTIVDSQNSIVEAMEYAFASHQLPRPSRNAVKSIVGLSLQQAIWELHNTADFNLIKSIEKNFKDAYAEIHSRPDHEDPLFDGVKDVLEAFSGQDNVFLGIATGKSRKGLLHTLERHDLSHYFHTLQTADDARSKPHPEMIDRALDATGIEKSDTVMIGDTTYDMEMGKIAKVTPIGVSWGYHHIDDLSQAGAKHIVHTFPELLSILTRFCEKKEAV